MDLEFLILSVFVLCILLWGYAIIACMRKLWMSVLRKRKLGIIPTVVVGNITVGGTGKTPFLLFLSDLFSEYRHAIVSRGYGRKSKGYREVGLNSTVLEVGDEPLELKRTLSEKGNEVRVFVGEDRLEAIEKVHDIDPKIEFSLLDDGLQHVKLRPDVGVVLTTFSAPYSNEYFSIPFGKLREFGICSREHDILVVTKCPEPIKQVDIDKWWEQNGKSLGFDRQDAYFAQYVIEWNGLINLNLLDISDDANVRDYRTSEDNRSDEDESSGEVEWNEVIGLKGGVEFNKQDSGLSKRSGILITGVVNSGGLSSFFEKEGYGIEKHFNYSDHYNFGVGDLKEWMDESRKRGIEYWFTTRKDWQRIGDVIQKNPEMVTTDLNIQIGVAYTSVRILEERELELKDKIFKKLKDIKR